MPIDTSMYRYQSPFRGKLSDSFNQGMKMGDLANQRKKNEQINDTFRRNMYEKPNGEIGFKKAAVLKDLAGLDAATAMKASDYFKKNELQESSLEADLRARAAYASKDQRSYLEGKKWLESQGVSTKDYPAIYDEGFNKSILDRAVPILDRMKIENNASMLKLMGLKQADDHFRARQDIDLAKLKMQIDEYNSKKSKGNSTFNTQVQKKKADSFQKMQASYTDFSNNLELIEDAISATIKHSNETLMGTGAFETAFGATGYLGGADEELRAKYSKVKIKNLINEMKGFAKSMDSNAERRAYEAKEAKLTNDEDTNLSILLGQKSVMMKLMTEAQAQREYVEKNGDLDGYKPKIDQLTSLIDQNGKLVLFPRSQKARMKKLGYQEIDDFAKKATKGGRPSKKGRGLEDLSDEELDRMIEETGGL